jgi:putative transposase
LEHGFHSGPFERWALVRVLPLIDQFTRECLLLHSDLSLNEQKVATALDTVLRTRSKPQSLSCDHGLNASE